MWILLRLKEFISEYVDAQIYDIYLNICVHYLSMSPVNTKENKLEISFQFFQKLICWHWKKKLYYKQINMHTYISIYKKCQWYIYIFNVQTKKQCEIQIICEAYANFHCNWPSKWNCLFVFAKCLLMLLQCVVKTM